MISGDAGNLNPDQAIPTELAEATFGERHLGIRRCTQRGRKRFASILRWGSIRQIP